MLRLTVCVSALLLLVLSGAAIGGEAPVQAAPVTAKVVSSFDHASIHYRVEGSGSPAVVLIHCWMCDSGIWDNVVPTLAKSYRVVTLDLPGHGVSGKHRKEWSMAAFGADVATVVNALRLDRVILVGHSMGGAVMLEAAARMPGKVVGMIGVDTLLDADWPSDPKEIDAWLAKMKADFRGTADQLVRMIAGKSADPVVIDRVARKMSSGYPAIGLALMDSLQHYDVKAGMERAHAPMVGTHSTMRPTNVVANRKYLPRYELLPLPEGVGISRRSRRRRRSTRCSNARSRSLVALRPRCWFRGEQRRSWMVRCRRRNGAARAGSNSEAAVRSCFSTSMAPSTWGCARQASRPAASASTGAIGSRCFTPQQPWERRSTRIPRTVGA